MWHVIAAFYDISPYSSRSAFLLFSLPQSYRDRHRSRSSSRTQSCLRRLHLAQWTSPLLRLQRQHETHPLSNPAVRFRPRSHRRKSLTEGHRFPVRGSARVGRRRWNGGFEREACEVAGLPTSSHTNACSHWRLRLRPTKQTASEVREAEETSVERSELSRD